MLCLHSSSIKGEIYSSKRAHTFGSSSHILSFMFLPKSIHGLIAQFVMPIRKKVTIRNDGTVTITQCIFISKINTYFNRLHNDIMTKQYLQLCIYRVYNNKMQGIASLIKFITKISNQIHHLEIQWKDELEFEFISNSILISFTKILNEMYLGSLTHLSTITFSYYPLWENSNGISHDFSNFSFWKFPNLINIINIPNPFDDPYISNKICIFNVIELNNSRDIKLKFNGEKCINCIRCQQNTYYRGSEPLLCSFGISLCKLHNQGKCCHCQRSFSSICCDNCLRNTVNFNEWYHTECIPKEFMCPHCKHKDFLPIPQKL